MRQKHKLSEWNLMLLDRVFITVKNDWTYKTLVTLTIIFTLRVLGQLIEKVFGINLTGNLNWDSSVLSYKQLLGLQVITLGLMIFSNYLIYKKNLKKNFDLGIILLTLGSSYLFLMLARLILCLSSYDHMWFKNPIPIIFHLVIALYLVSLGFYHLDKKSKNASHYIYPGLVISVFALHYLMSKIGFPLGFTTYVPVVVAISMVIVLEINLHYRKEWQANSLDITRDFSYMVIIQNLLPKFWTFWVILEINKQIPETSLQSFWPNHWNTFLQMILMMVTAELFRYWLHRASHKTDILWRLHSVHHSPKKLYWLNVGKFHPVEKCLQLVFDTIPFMLMGVSSEVLALYFIFYSTNGFFQHCNIDVKLGYLNYIISGPELHRWHHSNKMVESCSNYGNNLIIWDLVFNTWYLPKNQEVAKLGNGDDEYPQEFVGQMLRPFH